MEEGWSEKIVAVEKEGAIAGESVKQKIQKNVYII